MLKELAKYYRWIAVVTITSCSSPNETEYSSATIYQITDVHASDSGKHPHYKMHYLVTPVTVDGKRVVGAPTIEIKVEGNYRIKINTGSDCASFSCIPSGVF